MGRPSKYSEIKQRISEIEQWAKAGLIDEEIAKRLGIATSTFYAYQSKYAEFSEALKRGKAYADCEIEQSLYKRAIGYNERLLKQKITKDGDVINTYEDVHIPADTTAQIFWLKNRKPDTWRDRQEVGITAGTDELRAAYEMAAKAIKGKGG